MSTSETTANGVSRGLLIGLGAVVVLALLWFFVVNPLLFATEGDEDDFVVPRPGATEQPTGDGLVEEGEPDTEDVLETLPIETYEIFLARDPFSPVVPAPVTGPTDGDTADGGTDGTDGGTDGTDGTDDGTDGPDDSDRVSLIDIEDGRALIRVDGEPWIVEEGQLFGPNFEFQLISIDPPCVVIEGPGGRFTECIGDGDGTDGNGTDGDGTDGDGDGDGCTRRDGEVVCDGRVVSVVDVFVEGGEDVAVIQIDSTLFEVREGETFAEHFQVLSIDPPCVTLLFGDDSFTLCEGERVLK